MLKVSEILARPQPAQYSLTLPFSERQRSRLRTRLDSGEVVGLWLPRSRVLRGGDCLRTDTGEVIEVRAASENVSTASTPDPVLLARAAYHLGNRHVPLQVGSGWLRYEHDPVLDHMTHELGLSVIPEQAPFEPEAGAYHGGHHHPTDAVVHQHTHAHD
ncbi:MAG: urease accessory protein UreE [Gammaproteobacteria bacterium]|nr:urease accessory protein UreE [Gammaproteobacteria bacterium]